MKPTFVIRPSKAPIQVKVAVVAAAVASLGVALYGEPFAHIMVFVGIGYVTPILAAVIVGIAALRSSPNRIAQARTAILVLAVGMGSLAVFQVPGCFVANVLDQRDLDRTRVWCDDLVSRLEQWRSEHGTYPETLEGTSLVVDPPKHWQHGGRYQATNGEFELYYYGEGEADHWTYSSLRKSWR